MHVYKFTLLVYLFSIIILFMFNYEVLKILCAFIANNWLLVVKEIERWVFHEIRGDLV